MLTSPTRSSAHSLTLCRGYVPGLAASSCRSLIRCDAAQLPRAFSGCRATEEPVLPLLRRLLRRQALASGQPPRVFTYRSLSSLLSNFPSSGFSPSHWQQTPRLQAQWRTMLNGKESLWRCACVRINRYRASLVSRANAFPQYLHSSVCRCTNIFLRRDRWRDSMDGSEQGHRR